jgi:hypothetical protein
VREVHHDADAVHLGDDLLAEIAEAVVEPLAAGLAGVRVGELAVTVMGQRHVPGAAIVELLDALHRGRGITQGVAVLDANQGNLLAGFVDAADIGRGQRELDFVGSDLLGQQVNGVELGHRLFIGAVVAFGRQGSLSDVDNEERGIESALAHLRQVDLIAEVLCVVAFRGEVVGVDVVVGIERDDALMNALCLLDEGVVGGCLRVSSGRGYDRRTDERGGSAAREKRACHPGILRRGS